MENKSIKDGEKIIGRTLTATLDIQANHILIEHKFNHATATYYCALQDYELTKHIAGGGHEVFTLTPQEVKWLESIEGWVNDCENSY